MWKRSISFVLSLMLGVSLLAGPGGGGRSGGGSFSSGSRSSGPSRSFSPSRPSSPSASPSRSTGGGSFSGGNKAAAPTVRPTQSSMARVQQQTAMSTQAKSSMAQFKAPAAPAPASASIKSSPAFSRSFSPGAPRVTYHTYLGNRNAYYSSYRPPVYIYSYAPRYGMWDAMFMWMMLDNMNHNMYYNHRNEADYQNWRRDADKQAQTDADLRAKLAAMDLKVKELEKAKTPVDPSYMPPGVDPTVAMSVDAAEATLPQEQIQNETVPVTTQGDGFDDDNEAGVVIAWVFGSLIVIGLLIWGIATLVSRRNASNSFSSRYRL